MNKKLNLSATLLGGAPVDAEVLAQVLRLAPRLYCADGGANTAVALGLSPVSVVGDLDSLSAQTKAKLTCPQIFVDDQNSTDFEKCLNHISENVLICMGFLGQRLDHSLAAMNALTKYPHKHAILVGDTDICFRSPRTFEFDASVGDRVSLFPLTNVQAKSQGLLWPLDVHDLAPNGQIATSNQADGNRVKLDDVSGELLVILPLRFLSQVAQRLVNTLED